MTYVYDITIKSITKKSYLIEAEDAQIATDKALEKAISENPGADVWVEAVWPQTETDAS